MKHGQNNICYNFFATLANPTRLAILETLYSGPMNVSGLAETLDQEQSMISQNIKILESCSFIESERRGKEKFIFLNREIIEPLFMLVEKHYEVNCGSLKECPLGYSFNPKTL